MSNRERKTEADPSVPLQIIVTSLAAYYDYAGGISLKPCNWVKVYGPPGHTMNCNVSPGGEIIGLEDPSNASQLPGVLYSGDGLSYGTGPYSPTLDQNGFTWFLIRGENLSTAHAASELLEVTAAVMDQADQLNRTYGMPVFQNYTDANPQDDPNQHFIAYNYTTGAPADGVTPCCINVQADSRSGGELEVVVTAGNATIFGAPSRNPQSSTVTLSNDGCATILLLDTKAETVQFTIALPKVPGNPLGPFSVEFSSWPQAPLGR